MAYGIGCCRGRQQEEEGNSVTGYSRAVQKLRESRRNNVDKFRKPYKNVELEYSDLIGDCVLVRCLLHPQKKNTKGWFH